MSISDKRFKRGIIFQLTAVILFVLTLGTYAVFFSFFISLLLLIIGCVITFISGASLRQRILFSLWPVFSLVVIVPSAFIYSWWFEYRDMARYEPETYLIPEGFEGAVRIRFNHPKGIPIRYADKRREYVVPLHGILITSASEQINNSNDGDVEQNQEALRKYYFVSNGKRTPIPRVTEETIDSTSALIGVFVIYHGTDFIVAPQRDFPKYWIGNYEYRTRIDSVERVLIEGLQQQKFN